ncbi:very-long-chain 3-oxoacyl-CoA reductase [Acrasis kona]|uniref:Very-long-chain 3-oxoacyl-CoA reductase n=1 Tax=Acrasis kona TaxID=1008807 RepID=A0AAW2YJW2_9EUKA
MFTTIGIIATLYALFSIAVWAYRNFVHKSTLKFTSDQYSVVTGATAGIGEGYAEELASRKSNLVLVSRSQSKLDDLAAKLLFSETKYNVKVVTVAIDFAKDKSSEYVPKLRDAIKPLNVTTLINNVGVNNAENIPILFQEQPEQDQADLINVNLHATLNVTRVVIPKLTASGKGLIINLGSYTGNFPTPLNAVYSGTKAFVEAWSSALRTELANKRVEVLNYTPMYVQTAMTQIKKTSLTVINGRKLASDSLKQLGAPLLPSSYSPYYVHSLTMFAYSLLPASFLSSKALGVMNIVRSRMLKKKQTTTN